MSISKRLAEIQEKIKEACKRSGRKSEQVHLLAVSKFQPTALIEEAYACGVRDFGENYVQELMAKQQALAHLKDIQWHLIGSLQTGKVKQALLHAHYFHALDSENLMQVFVKKAAELKLKTPFPIFIEVNIDKEATKAGIFLDEVPKLIHLVRAEPLLKLEGLMCIPKPQKNSNETRLAYRALSELAKQVSPGASLKLSMGMSDDFEIAIEEGAHWVRIGRKLFGERLQKRK